jgi:hypothetical protein
MSEPSRLMVFYEVFPIFDGSTVKLPFYIPMKSRQNQAF